MAKPITDAQREEWAAVHRETLALAEFLDRRGLNLSAAIAAHEEPRHPFRARLAGFREARNDLLENASYMSGEEQRELDKHLRARLGISLDSLQGKRLARLQALRDKGRLSTDDQFRLVRSRYEQIWDDPAHAEEAEALQNLMNEYDDRKRRPRKKRP